jgi:hypothetical protein
MQHNNNNNIINKPKNSKLDWRSQWILTDSKPIPGINHTCSYFNTPHITIHNTFICHGYKGRVTKLINDNIRAFCTLIAKSFQSTIATCFLHSPELKILGINDTKFLVAAYSVPEGFEKIITDFRKRFYATFYDIVKTNTSTRFKFDKDSNDKFVNYQLCNTNDPNEVGEVAMNIPKHSFGVGVWKPHQTLASLNDLKAQIPELYYQIIQETHNGPVLKTTDVRRFFGDDIVPDIVIFQGNNLKVSVGNQEFFYDV